MNEKTPLLTIQDFCVSFIQYQKGLQQKKLDIIHKINLSVYKGEILAIIGASGSGKSLLAHGILGILPKNAVTSGKMYYDGKLLDDRMRMNLRGKEISLIPQSVSYLDPVEQSAKQIESPFAKEKIDINKILEKFQLNKKNGELYPFQLSGGMARRVLISTAIASGSKLIIADEPTPGLHKSIVQETLDSFMQMKAEGRSVVMITHDIDLAFQVADRIAVFNEGQIISVEKTENFLHYPSRLNHPFSRSLWNALPQNGFYSQPEKIYDKDCTDDTYTLKVIAEYEKNPDVLLSFKRKDLFTCSSDSHTLSLKDITFRYTKKGRVILSNINENFCTDEITGIVGPSGYGKSTMGKICGGIIKPQIGKVLIDGKDIPTKEWNPVQIINQSPELAVNPRWRMEQVLAEADCLNHPLLKQFGIKDSFLKRFPSELSGGELQRFCILRALNPKTKFIIADEISTMLDVITQSQLWHLILEYTKQHHIGVIVITHNKYLAEKICTRIVRYE